MAKRRIKTDETSDPEGGKWPATDINDYKAFVRGALDALSDRLDALEARAAQADEVDRKLGKKP